MRSLDDLFDEFAAALQFPYYFGENWPALDECLGDLEWIEPHSGLILLVYEADQVLTESTNDLPSLVRTIERAHSVYSQPVNDGEWWDRPALPFHVVLQLPVAELDRWIEAGATPSRLLR